MAVYDGIGLKSFNEIVQSFDVIDVAFDNVLVALLLRVVPPVAPSTVKVILPTAPTYTRMN
tara:strand:+ start:229 stop:411 length:183 start_codon:yes stop_codon:yes gene_type:complete